MIKWERDLNALLIFILCGVLLSAYGVQFIYHETPCPLCLLQRLGMIGVAAAACLNIWCGVKMTHYALALFSAIFGGFVALRQISLHVCPGTPAFGFPVLGLSLYTWSFIVFVCAILAVAVLLCFYNPVENHDKRAPLNWWAKFASVLILLVATANIVTTLLQCGLGPCTD